MNLIITKYAQNFIEQIKIFLVRLCWIELFIKVAADIIYLPPMNAKLIKSAILVSRLLIKAIVEMYISLYDTM